MSRITKAMLESNNKWLLRKLQELEVELEHKKEIIQLLRQSPTSGLFMAMMSTNKLARKIVGILSEAKK